MKGIDSRFALAVQRLARQDLKVSVIATELHCAEADVMEALRMLCLPLPGEHHTPTAPPSDAELMDRVPKKWQDHYGRT